MLITRLGFWAPSSPHPPQHSSDFAKKNLGWNMDIWSEKAWPFHFNFQPQILIHKHSSSWSENPRRLWGRIIPGHHILDNAFFPQKYFISSPSITSESRPHYSRHCSLSFENPDEAFLRSLWRWQFKSSIGWHDNSNAQFSLLSPSVAETLLAGLPGKTVAKETAVHSSSILSLAEGHCCAILGPLLSKTSLAT